jgi:hypothetical protein
MYCGVHARMLQLQVDASGIVEYHQDNGGPGMVEDVWFLVGNYIPFVELPGMYLTCKTLFNSFTSKFFERNPRYLVINKLFKTTSYLRPESGRHTKLRGIPGDEMCKRVTCHSYYGHLCIDKFVYTCYPFHGSDRGPLPQDNVLTPVKSYKSAKIVFRALAGKMNDTYSVFVDETSQNIIPKLLDIAFKHFEGEFQRRFHQKYWYAPDNGYIPWCDPSRIDEAIRLLDLVIGSNGRYEPKITYHDDGSPQHSFDIFYESLQTGSITLSTPITFLAPGAIERSALNNSMGHRDDEHT